MNDHDLDFVIDAEILAETVVDLLNVDPKDRAAAVDQFAEIDPILGRKLRIAVGWQT